MKSPELVKNAKSIKRRSRRSTQGDFFAVGCEYRPAKTFGGSDLKGNPRTKRPFSAKKAVHLVMKSRLAIGERSMWRKSHKLAIEDCVNRQARESGVKLYSFVNVGNHLHLVIKAESRSDYRRFVRSVSGLIARIVLGRERGSKRTGGVETIDARRDQKGRSESPVGGDATELKLRFWDARPFTRIVEWGRDFTHLTKYILKNRLEAFGFSTASARYYADLLNARLAPP